MAVRFHCPACKQPIEIDDEWAGQSVACPYCDQVVTAPQQSNWPEDQVPVAKPSIAAPQADGSQPWQIASMHQPSPRARWALVVVVTALVLTTIAWSAWMGALYEAAVDRVGADASEQELQQAMTDAVQRREVQISSFAQSAAWIGGLCGFAGVILGISSLLRQEPRKITAITSCIIGSSFTCCAGVLTLGNMAPPFQPAENGAQDEAAEEWAPAPETNPAGGADPSAQGPAGIRMITWK